MTAVITARENYYTHTLARTRLRIQPLVRAVQGSHLEHGNEE